MDSEEHVHEPITKNSLSELGYYIYSFWLRGQRKSVKVSLWSETAEIFRPTIRATKAIFASTAYGRRVWVLIFLRRFSARHFTATDLGTS